MERYARALRGLLGHEAMERAPRYVRDAMAELRRAYSTVEGSIGWAENRYRRGNPKPDACLPKVLAELTAADYQAIAALMVWRAECRLRRQSAA